MLDSYLWSDIWSSEFEQELELEREQEIERIDAKFAEYRQQTLIKPEQNDLFLQSDDNVTSMMIVERARLISAIDKILAAKREKFYLEQGTMALLRSCA